MHSTAGKGDASRISNLARFKNQLDQVALPRIPCADDSTFTRTKRGFKKVYGTPATKPDVIEFSVPPLSVVISPNEIAPEL